MDDTSNCVTAESAGNTYEKVSDPSIAGSSTMNNKFQSDALSSRSKTLATENVSTGEAVHLLDSASSENVQGDSQMKMNEEDTAVPNANNLTDDGIVVPLKEEVPSLGNLLCMKKEDSLSPHISPLGFGTIGNNTDILAEQTSGLGTAENVVTSKSAPNSEKSDVGGGMIDSFQLTTNNFTSENVSINHSMDYLQQQNHVFVFSTQLANRAADSVLVHEFQNIIAYHCSQPSTQNFLEDFFMKHPAKVNRFQRSTLLNTNNLPPTLGQLWPTNNNSYIKLGHKQNKMYYDHAGNSMKTDVGNNILNTFIDGENNKHSNLICFDKSHNSVMETENAALESTGKILDSSCASSILEPGVKVPDEKLTPHQFQHRLEQLAKLDKMTQLLFPEERSANESSLNASNCNSSVIAPPHRSIIPDNSTISESKGNNLSCSLPDACSTNIMLPQEVLSELGVGIVCGSNATSTIARRQSDLSGSNSTVNLDTRGISHGNILSNAELIHTFASPACEGSKNPTNRETDVGLHSVEWNKMQHNFTDDRSKGNKRPISNGSDLVSNYRRSGSTSVMRSMSQGPPPPYHPTQRPASEPTTQTSNPSSPTNPTSNISLPSPRASGGSGVTINSPNLMDNSSQPSSSSVTPSVVTVVCTSPSINSSLTTNCFANDSELSVNRNRNAGCISGAVNTTTAGLSGLASNPSTPISHTSPKDMESFSTNVGEIRNIGSGTVHSRSPCNILEGTGGIEGRFLTSPGISFPQQINNNGLNHTHAKSVNALERQNSTPGGTSPFGRRPENVPLNPNTSRLPNKLNQNFDPITSLAQMSQQLNCNSISSGNSARTNIDENIDIAGHQSMDGIMPAPNTNGVETGTNSMLNMGSYPAVNCHSPFNQLLHPMGQRMSKACTGSGHGFSGSFQGAMSQGPRVAGRTPINFSGFSAAPNIQVRANTPNTIQYMPVRSQNNSPCIRLPPNFDFLHRFPNAANDTTSTSMMEQHKVQHNSLPGSNMLNSNEINIGQRTLGINMRTSGIRQQNMNINMRPPSGNMGPLLQSYSGLTTEGIEPNDPGSLNSNTNFEMSMFRVGTQQKMTKISPPGSGNTAHNPTSGDICAGLAQQSPSSGALMGLNNAIISNNSNNTAMSNAPGSHSSGNFKSYTNQLTNDVNYNSQYQQFQQDLYATSNSRHQQQGSIPAAGMVSNVSPDSKLFSSK